MASHSSRACRRGKCGEGRKAFWFNGNVGSCAGSKKRQARRGAGQAILQVPGCCATPARIPRWESRESVARSSTASGPTSCFAVGAVLSSHGRFRAIGDIVLSGGSEGTCLPHMRSAVRMVWYKCLRGARKGAIASPKTTRRRQPIATRRARAQRQVGAEKSLQRLLRKKGRPMVSAALDQRGWVFRRRPWLTNGRAVQGFRKSRGPQTVWRYWMVKQTRALRQLKYRNAAERCGEAGTRRAISLEHALGGDSDSTCRRVSAGDAD